MKKTYQVILSVLLAVLLLSGCVRGEASQESTAPVDTMPTETQQMSQPHKQTDPSETEETTQPQTETEPTQELTTPTEHTHQYSKTVTAPTCTTDGFTTYTCQCGYSYNSNMVPALGHSWSDWETIKDATETESGLKRRTCRVCAAVQEEPIEPGTEPTEHVHQYTAVVTNPTCTAEGYTTYTCACGHSHVDDKVPAKGHAWGEWETTKPATETEPGEKQHTCTVCGVTEKGVIPVECKHEYTQTVTEPTCTTGGFTTYTCTKCNYSYIGNDKPALGHKYGNWVVDSDPTPQAPGSKHRSCEHCGDVQNETIPYTPPTEPTTPPTTEETTQPTEST